MAEVSRFGEGGAAARPFAGASCAIGVFDGVHEGHRYLLERVCREARERGTAAVAVTFDTDPDELFRPQGLKKLVANGDRLALLAESGVDHVVALPFTREFAALPPERFLADVFGGAEPALIQVGSDFRFGAKAAGTVGDLAAWGARAGTEVRAVDLLAADGAPVTATRIRGLLAHGSIEEANRLLGRPYFMRGTVEPGRGEGADMGIRTANLHVPDMLRALGDGVYAAWAVVGGARYKAAVNVGVAATFADRATATVEAHLLDFEGDLYGADVTVEFLHWLRPMRTFDSIDELVSTVQSNITWVRENL